MSEQLDGQQAGATQDGGLKDPLSVRNTDTGSMKRMAAENSSNQARKTIKLKPLAAKKGGVAPSDLTSASMQAADDGVAEQATVAMDRSAIEEQTRKLQKPQVPVASVATGSSFSSAPGGLPGSKQTIKLRPSTSGSPDAGATEQRPASAQTIKLTPKSSAPDATAPSVEATAPVIKEVHTASMAKNTIRLVPKKAEVNSSAPVQPKPSDPTINLQGSPSEVKPSDPTSRLSPTQMMPQPGAEAPAVETKTKIGIKHYAAPQEAGDTSVGQAAVPGAEEAEASEADVAAKDEPSIIFTIAAVISLLTIGFLSFVLFAQYDNHWMNGNISVPGVTKLVGSK